MADGEKTFFRRLRSGIQRWVREPSVVWRVEAPERTTSIQVQQWLPFPVFVTALIWYVAAPSPIAMMSTTAIGLMLLGSFMWARAMAHGVTGNRRLRFAAMQVGDELEEEVRLVNQTPLPVIWTEFVDRSNMPGYTVSSARAADPGSRTEWRVQTICSRRGVFSLGPWELRIGEPFGIFLVHQVYHHQQDLLVYPPLAVLPERILPHRGALGDHRPLNQPISAETIASSSVRAYLPGDPLRQIHWRTTARRDEPFVKLFAPEAASKIWLIPDFDAGVHVGDGPESSQETMVTVAASLAADLLRDNLSVGLIASSKGKESIVLPRQGQTHLWDILQALAPVYAEPDWPLSGVLERARALISGSDVMIVITPSLEVEWIAPLKQMSRSRGASGRAGALVLDPASFGGKDSAIDFLPVLLEQGIGANILRSEDVRVISGYYGEISRWEFSVSGTGKAVARKTPRLASVMGDRKDPIISAGKQ